MLKSKTQNTELSFGIMGLVHGALKVSVVGRATKSVMSHYSCNVPLQLLPWMLMKQTPICPTYL